MIELASYIANMYSGKVVEVGVGYNFTTSDYLEERGFEVIRTDVVKTREDVVIDDVCMPNVEIYRSASLIYSIKPPYEIQGCILRLARNVGCDTIILPLKNEIVDGGKLINYRGISFYLFTPQYP